MIDNLRKYIATNTSTGLVWFYCDGVGNRSAKTEIRYIFGSIFRQLLEIRLSLETTGVLEFMEAFHKHHQAHGESALSAGLISAIGQLELPSDVFIVVDGVDECPKGPEICMKLLQLSVGKVKVLVTSRNERDIAKVFHNKPHVLFTEDISRQDIATHIDWAFEHDEKLKMINLKLKNELKEKILSKSGGT